MKKELVIALYDKPLSWIENIQSDTKVTVYRKGEISSHPSEIIIPKNVGRDVHTFFYHIYNNYENIADVTFFCQDSPFDHFGNLIEVVNTATNSLNSWADMKFYGYYGFHNNTLGTEWALQGSDHFLNSKCLKCESNGHPHDSGLNCNEVWNELFTDAPPAYYEFIPGGHFCVTREAIHTRSKEFYNKILNMLETRPRNPWEIERLEPYIFCKTYTAKI
jgi:Protein of unknown function (DUF3431)